MGKTSDHNYKQPSYFDQLKQKDKSRKSSYANGGNFNSHWESSQTNSSAMSSSFYGVHNRPSSPSSLSGITDPSSITQRQIDGAWAVAKESCKANPKYVRRQLHCSRAASARWSGGRSAAPQKRSGWKTVRLFVSSTFHDFQAERDLLVKKVFPDLKAWCFDHKIHFVEIDLRWGVPQGSDAEVALRTCLGEIERCYSDNGLPFFLNMQSERVGWLPLASQVPKPIREEFDWVDGLSITEMEVLHAAIRSRNPNAFFLIRHPSFLQTVPTDKRSLYQDSLPIANYKSIKFREVLDSTFGQNQKVTYYARYEGEDVFGHPQLTGYQDLVTQQVLDFFKMRIMEHYPMGDDDSSETASEWEKLTEMHETFMTNEATEIGKLPVWDKQIADLVQYVGDENSDVPYLLQAKSGSGKSSCLSSFIMRIRKTFPDAKVFCHFVGAVPGSINYKQLVKRIAHFLGEAVDDTDDFNLIVQQVCRKLSSERTTTLVIVIDAYNQLTEPSTTWLPYPLSPFVKVVITARPESGVTELIQRQYPKPLLSKDLIPMDEQGKREMVSTILGNYNKKLDPRQMDLLLKKECSSSYYWLSLACEELRIYGHFSKLTEKIEELPDDLVDLQCDILKRLEEEQPQEELLVATLCFLLVSQAGLLEIELLELLAEPPNLLPRALREGRYADRLPYKVWSEIMRDLRSFVKSMGDPSEGRLKIYHATFGKAVEQFYFERLGSRAAKENYDWFHNKLADYFKSHSTFERRLEEYPYHLAALKRTDELCNFLCQWDTINSYFQPRFSKHLSHLWSYVDPDYSTMSELYLQKTMDTIKNVDEDSRISAIDLLKLATICYQNGRYSDCNAIIAEIENAQSSIAELLILDDIQAFNAEMKYTYAKSKERSTQVKDVFALNEDSKALEMVESCLMDALDAMNRLDTGQHKKKAAELENRIGMFHITKMFALENTNHKMDEHDEANFRERALEWVTRAHESYKKLEDQLGVADTYTSMGVCSKDKGQKLKYFRNAEEIIGSAGGSAEDASIGRLYMNMGIFHELDDNFGTAIEYYHKYHDNSHRLFGATHPETKRAADAIRKLQTS